MVATGRPIGAQPNVAVVEDFDRYTSSDYVQNQGWSLWRRFGTATNDGLYSVPEGDGRGGRAASYLVNWGAGNTGYVRYTFPSPASFASGTIFSIDLSVDTALPGTEVSLVVADGEPSLASTTAYRIGAGRPLVGTEFQTHAFVLEGNGVRRVSGRAPLGEVLDRLASATLVFNNRGGAGSQAILIDNFTITTPRSP